ncbi:MAG: TonB-dependent receptor plug domain-containing protein [Ignavibacteria bacterium]
MNFLLSFMVMLFICVQINAQKLTIVNAEDTNPISHAILLDHSTKKWHRVNVDGIIMISALSIQDSFSIRAHGFKTKGFRISQIPITDTIIALDEMGISLNDIVIAASRWSQQSSDQSQKNIGISLQEVALKNPQTAADLLGVSGKVFIQKSQQGGGSPMIRGFATNRLLYSIDGIRMNTAIFRAGNIQNVISLDPFAIERTEVLFGPSSVIYGSDAIGGVMSFQTLSPMLSDDHSPNMNWNVHSRYSSANNEITGHADFRIGWKEFASVTSITHSNYGDLYMGSYGPSEYLRPFSVKRIGDKDSIIQNPDQQLQIPSGYSQLNIMQKFLYTPHEDWHIEYGLHLSKTSEYDRYDRHIRYKDGLPRYGEWKYGPQIWNMHALSIQHAGQYAFYDSMQIRLAYQFFEESRISRDIYMNTREIRKEQVDAYSFNIDLVKSIGEVQWYYGLEGVLNDVQSMGINQNIVNGDTFNGPSRYPNSDWQSFGAYLTGNYALDEKTNIQSGLRISYYGINATFDTTFYPFPFTATSLSNMSLTGNAGIVHRISNDLSLSANIATAFRSPNIDDMGKVFDIQAGYVVVPNTSLKAEQALNGDIGLTKIFADKVKIDIAGYYTILNDALVRRDYTLNGQDSILYDGELSRVQAIQNAATAFVWGFQFGLEAKFGYGLSFHADINHQIGEEEMDDGTKSPSRHAPPLFGMSSLRYKKGSFVVDLGVQFSGERSFETMPFEEIGKPEIYAVDMNGKPYSPAWHTLNLKVGYDIHSNLRVNAGIENITDQRYRPYTSGIVSPGRNFVLSLQLH